MTEEIIENKEEAEEESTLAPEEELASEGGWKPEDDYTGEDGTWIDARTFNMRGELMDRIKSQTSQLRGQDRKIMRLEDGLKNLAEHNTKVEEVAFKKAITELKSLKKDALEEADHEQVVEIDDQIAELKASQKDADNTIQHIESNNHLNPEVTEWLNNNDWYKTDTTLRGAADALTMEMVQAYPELKGNPSAILEKVSKRLKTEFPTKFGGRKKTSQSVTEPGQADTSNRSKGGSRNWGQKHLNEMQLEIGRTFVEAGAMKNLKEYAEQLAEIGELDAQRGA